MTYRVRLTAEALEDLDRLYDFLVKLDLDAAERALAAIERAFELLTYSPFSCRKALLQKSPRWREILIPFGHSGYVALFEIDDDQTVTVTAVRHQREEDYHFLMGTAQSRLATLGSSTLRLTPPHSATRVASRCGRPFCAPATNV